MDLLLEETRRSRCLPGPVGGGTGATGRKRRITTIGNRDGIPRHCNGFSPRPLRPRLANERRSRLVSFFISTEPKGLLQRRIQQNASGLPARRSVSLRRRKVRHLKTSAKLEENSDEPPRHPQVLRVPSHRLLQPCRASNSAPKTPLEPGGDAIHKFCLARLQFGDRWLSKQSEQTAALEQQASSIHCRVSRPKRNWPSRRPRLHGMRHLQIPRTKRRQYASTVPTSPHSTIALTSSLASAFSLQIPQDLD